MNGSHTMKNTTDETGERLSGNNIQQLVTVQFVQSLHNLYKFIILLF